LLSYGPVLCPSPTPLFSTDGEFTRPVFCVLDYELASNFVSELWLPQGWLALPCGAIPFPFFLYTTSPTSGLPFVSCRLSWFRLHFPIFVAKLYEQHEFPTPSSPKFITMFEVAGWSLGPFNDFVARSCARFPFSPSFNRLYGSVLSFHGALRVLPRRHAPLTPSDSWPVTSFIIIPLFCARSSPLMSDSHPTLSFLPFFLLSHLLLADRFSRAPASLQRIVFF